MLTGLAGETVADDGVRDAAERNKLGALLRTPGAVVLVGERAAQTPGLLTAVGDLVDATGAALAWVPRRAGERGALDAGAHRQPAAGRPAAVRSRGPRRGREGLGRIHSGDARPGHRRDPGRRRDRRTGTDRLRVAPTASTRRHSTARSTIPRRARGLAGLLIGGVEISDLPDPAAALAAVASAGFVVSLEIRVSAVTELANVVFPVAAAAEKSGAYVNWEGRVRPFAAALPEAGMLDEARILDTLGVEMDVDLYTQTPAAASAEIARLGVWSGPASPPPDRVAPVVERPAPASRVPAGQSWRMNLDGGRGDGRRAAPGGHRQTRRRPAVRRAPRRRSGCTDGDQVTVRGAGQFDHAAARGHRDARRRRLAARAHRRHRHHRPAGRRGRRPGAGDRAGAAGRCRKGTLMSASLAGPARPRGRCRWAPTAPSSRCSPTTRGGWG